MRKILQRLLSKPLTWIANSLAASPKKDMVEKSLTELYQQHTKKSSSLHVIETDLSESRFIIFSDQHKGNKSWADDFMACEMNYTNALKNYLDNGFSFINLGDSEELWKFKVKDILNAHGKSFQAEAAFQPLKYFKTFGNHDIIWKNNLDVKLFLKETFRLPLTVYEGIILRCRKTKLDIFLTHGHQGDLMSDNNAFSTWIVAHIWMPLQRYLRINVNSPSNTYDLRNGHNRMMYDWSSRQQNLVLITGHTHQPVFASGRYYNHPSNHIPGKSSPENLRPTYFNSGCCCLNDGDITGIEICDGVIRLVKWFNEEVKSEKKILEEISFEQLMKDLELKD